MTTVYLAEDLKHHRKVAVKVLRPELGAKWHRKWHQPFRDATHPNAGYPSSPGDARLPKATPHRTVHRVKLRELGHLGREPNLPEPS